MLSACNCTLSPTQIVAGPLIVHCTCGSGRTVTLIALELAVQPLLLVHNAVMFADWLTV
ncbi:MAG: hypothetical protein EBV20_13140 [Betaproteobacteria bacterium]|nr:hypothetical protein [Betaproteobacteria bacterium]